MVLLSWVGGKGDALRTIRIPDCQSDSLPLRFHKPQWSIGLVAFWLHESPTFNLQGANIHIGESGNPVIWRPGV